MSSDSKALLVSIYSLQLALRAARGSPGGHAEPHEARG
jgi:hypothetical protein